MAKVGLTLILGNRFKMKRIDMTLRNIINEDFLEELIKEELMMDLEISEDNALKSALRTVIAYYSVPGEYMEGAYDGE